MFTDLHEIQEMFDALGGCLERDEGAYVGLTVYRSSAITGAMEGRLLHASDADRRAANTAAVARWRERNPDYKRPFRPEALIERRERERRYREQASEEAREKRRQYRRQRHALRKEAVSLRRRSKYAAKQAAKGLLVKRWPQYRGQTLLSVPTIET